MCLFLLRLSVVVLYVPFVYPFNSETKSPKGGILIAAPWSLGCQDQCVRVCVRDRSGSMRTTHKKPCVYSIALAADMQGFYFCKSTMQQFSTEQIEWDRKSNTDQNIWLIFRIKHSVLTPDHISLEAAVDNFCKQVSKLTLAVAWDTLGSKSTAAVCAGSHFIGILYSLSFKSNWNWDQMVSGKVAAE